MCILVESAAQVPFAVSQHSPVMSCLHPSQAGTALRHSLHMHTPTLGPEPPGGVQHWQEAIRKTDLAEKEVSTAALEADRAQAALGKAQQAQNAVDRHASKHDTVSCP